MRFNLGLYVTHSGEKYGSWIEIDSELAKVLLRYKDLVDIVALPFVFLVVAKPDAARPLIVETEWPIVIGLEEFAIKPSGVLISVIDENGTALSTETIPWAFLHRIIGPDQNPPLDK